jgi:predicted phosphoribosyltransferase
MAPTFRDRVDAGIRLACRACAPPASATPSSCSASRGAAWSWPRRWRGELGAPLDVLVVRKVGVPGHEELAAGAVASGGTTVVNDDVLLATGLSRGELEQRAAERPPRRRGDGAGGCAATAPRWTSRAPPRCWSTTVWPPGATMRAAAVAARQAGAARVVVAAPVASPEAVRLLEVLADEVVCLSVPSDLRAVGPVVSRLLSRSGGGGVAAATVGQ